MRQNPEKEVEVTTVGELRKALEGVPDDMPIEDPMGEQVLLAWWHDKETSKRIIEVS